MRRRLFGNPLKRIMARCRCRKTTQSRDRPALPDPQLEDGGGVTSDNSPLVVRTADVAETDHGYDTYFSLPSEFPPSVSASGSNSLSSNTRRYQPRVRLSLPAAYKMRALSSSGEPSDTYFSPPVTGLASND